MPEVNDQDKLWAAVSWVIPIVAVVVLFVEDMKNRPFQKYHAINSLLFTAVLVILFIVGSILITIISFVTLGFGSILYCCLFLLFLPALYWAFQAYQGEWVEIPYLTDFAKNQGWL